MKFKSLLTLIVAFAFALPAKAQTPSTALDAVPDTADVGALSRLPAATASDTLVQNVKVKVNGKSFNLALYKVGRNLVSAAGFGGEAATQINNIIALTPNERKVLDLFDLLQQKASYLYHLTFTDNLDPLQQRIGYSWGSKDYQLRAKPPGDGDLCTYQIHGLDCSGFIYQIFKLNGIEFPVDQCCADEERRPDFLKKYLAQFYFGTIPFDVKDMKHLKVNEMQSGDIIYFTNSKGVYHIGIVLSDGQGAVSLYQCIGNPNRSPDNMTWCTKNLDTTHGIVISELDPSFESRKYAVVRVLAK